MNIIVVPCECGGQFVFSVFAYKDGPCAIGKCNSCEKDIAVSLKDIIDQLQIGFNVKKPKKERK